MRNEKTIKNIDKHYIIIDKQGGGFCEGCSLNKKEWLKHFKNYVKNGDANKIIKCKHIRSLKTISELWDVKFIRCKNENTRIRN